MSIDLLEYNTERKRLVIPAYGRHIQTLVDHMKTIEDREERNKMANAIIAVMANLSPGQQDLPDFQQMLWTQLAMMSNFELDVDAPVELPTADEHALRPNILEYPQKSPKYRYYGSTIVAMINKAKQWEYEEEKKALLLDIGNQMKKSYLAWNRDSVDDAVILHHLYELSNGEIDLREDEEFKLDDTRELKKAMPEKQIIGKQKGRKNKGHKNNRGQKKNSNNYRKKRN